MDNIRPNYLKELFFHENNLYAAAAAVVTSVLVSLPFDSLGLLPMFGFLAVQAGMFWGGVADSAKWRNYVDTKERKRLRTESRSRLLEDLKRYSDLKMYKRYIHQYNQMCERVQAMYGIARDTRTNISAYEVDRFNDMTVSYLSLLYAWLNSDSGLASQRLVDAQDNIIKIEARLRTESLSTTDRGHLNKALVEYRGVVERSKRRESRLLTIEASLNTIPDKLEEVYQMLSAAPYSSDTSQRIEESLNNLLMQEEVDSLVEMELSGLGGVPVAAPSVAAPAKKAQAAKQTVSR